MSGELEPGTQIDELGLCKELGVSRTPLREALLRLDFEGFVEARRGKGFIVTPLRADTAYELHSMVGLLEGLAVRSLANRSQEQLTALADKLERANEDMVEVARRGDEESEERLIEMGDAWHATLMGAWDNSQFHEVLALLKARLYRYTYIFLSKPIQVSTTLEQHRGIIEAIRNRDIERAAELMSEHWMSGAEAKYDFLRRTEEERSA